MTSVSWSQDNLRNYLGSIKASHLKDSINLTTMSFEMLPQMDSTLLTSKNLVSLVKENEYDVGNFNQADCRVLKYWQGNEFDLLILIYYTSLAGDGNPIVLLSTISKEDRVIDQEEIAIRYCHDPGYEPTQILILNTVYNFELVTREIRRKQVEYDFIFESDKTKKTIYKIVEGIIKT